MKRTSQSFGARLAGVVAFVGIAASCAEPVGPAARRPGRPEFSPAAVAAITLDQQEGALNTGTPWPGGGTHVGKAFDANPHLGDAIVATFYWRGTTNTITSVTDHLEDGTPVGNTYTLVDFVTAGGYSMATYVATDVKNFPDPAPSPDQLLAVHAIFADSVAEGGIMISAYSGVESAYAQALGSFHSASGTASTTTVADPGAITAAGGALVYGVTVATPVADMTPPAGYSFVTTMWDSTLKTDGEYAIQGAAGTADPQWTWSFTSPGTWMATALTLNPKRGHLAFTVQPSTTLPLTTITPAVQVALEDDQGQVITDFTDTVSVAIGHNGGLLLPGTLSGTRRVAAVNGVATFADLSIDQIGNGYTLQASAPDVTGAESDPFDIGVSVIGI